MSLKKIAISLICSSLILGSYSFAKPNKEAKELKQNHKKAKKKKHLPPGLQKKLKRGGELPPGWRNKLVKGEVLDQDILNHSVILDRSDYAKYPYKTEDTEVYKIKDRIIKVMKATNVILDVLDLNNNNN